MSERESGSLSVDKPRVSATPRTSAFCEGYRGESYASHFVDAVSFARKLERELAEVQRVCGEALKRVRELESTPQPDTVAVPRSSLEQWRKWLEVRDEGIVQPPLLTDSIVTEITALLSARSAGTRRTPHCQNGAADVCLASQADGVVCPEDSCDIDDGIRKTQAGSPRERINAHLTRLVEDNYEENRVAAANAIGAILDSTPFSASGAWTPVTTPPPKAGHYLALRKGDQYTELGSNYFDGKDWRFSDGSNCSDYPVEWWMPLPSAPADSRVNK